LTIRIDWEVSVGLLEHDYEDLARQVQTGLERIAVNFLRSHGARVHQDLMDFHGNERIDLELSYGQHTLRVRQAGRPRGPGFDSTEAAPAEVEEVFESTFDGWPSTDVPPETIADWLRGLPVGEAARSETRTRRDPANPFVTEQATSAPRQAEREPALNPFLSELSGMPGPNPFAEGDRERKRQEMLRRLKGDDDE
jgi:hypothetical protein